MSIDTHMTEFNVHWAEMTEEGRTIFHMNLVEVFVLQRYYDKKQFEDIRRMVGNILAWGTGQRKREIHPVITKIQDKRA